MLYNWRSLVKVSRRLNIDNEIVSLAILLRQVEWLLFLKVNRVRIQQVAVAQRVDLPVVVHQETLRIVSYMVGH